MILISYIDNRKACLGKMISDSSFISITETLEISDIIEKQYARAIQLLEENKDKLTELAEVLLEKEVIFKDNLEKIFGERNFKKEVHLTDQIKEEEE